MKRVSENIVSKKNNGMKGSKDASPFGFLNASFIIEIIIIEHRNISLIVRISYNLYVNA